MLHNTDITTIVMFNRSIILLLK